MNRTYSNFWVNFLELRWEFDIRSVFLMIVYKQLTYIKRKETFDLNSVLKKFKAARMDDNYSLIKK